MGGVNVGFGGCARGHGLTLVPAGRNPPSGFAHKFVMPAPRATGFGLVWVGRPSDRAISFFLLGGAVTAHASNVQCFFLALVAVHATQRY
jgi:hypothetical protein